jgi:hypothetical protein
MFDFKDSELNHLIFSFFLIYSLMFLFDKLHLNVIISID